MSSNNTVALGSCPCCQSGNPYTNVVCSECGARLPWADAVLTGGAPNASSTAVSAVASVPFVPTPPLTSTHVWKNTHTPTTFQQASQQNHRPIIIRVSARILDWPFLCPCCGDVPDTTRIFTHTNQRGQRFVRVTNENWSIPYCYQCNEHLEIFDLAVGLHEKANSLISNSNTSLMTGTPSTDGCTLFARWYFFCLFLAALTGHFFAGIINCLLFAFVLTFGMKPFSSAQHTAKLALADTKARAEAKQLVEQADVVAGNSQDEMKQYCCWPGASVTYDGAFGTVHTFTFYNPDYASAFVQLNAGKIVQ